MTAPKYSSSSWGFTLVELIVVVAIIGILTTIVVINVSSAAPSSRDGRRISDMNALETSLENYFSQEKLYPAASHSGASYFIEDSYTDETSFLKTELVDGNYVKDIVKDPRNTSTYKYEYGNPNLSSVADQQKYYLKSRLEIKTSGENIFRYCNGTTFQNEYYYMKFSSYTFRTSFTGEDSCATCNASCHYKRTW